MKPIISVRIPSRWYQDGRWRYDNAVFKLGLGPCGRTVMVLECVISHDMVRLNQACSDGSVKSFTYPIGLVTGRVEIEYG